MKLNIGVMYGGPSVEHEISIISANQVMEALDKDKYNIIPIYIDKAGDFYTSREYQDMELYKDLQKVVKKGTKVIFKKVNSNVAMYNFKNIPFAGKLATIDIFFPVLHGTFGEDGTIQGLLESLDATFVGCSAKAAVNGQDKVFMKNILRDNNIKVVDFTWFYNSDYFADSKAVIKKIERKLKYPVIVKPASLGSSIGINKAKDQKELCAAIDDAIQYDNKILVEKVIENLTEVNCAVLGDYSEQQTSVIEEVVQSDEILSYDDKYQNKDSKAQGMASVKRIIPAKIGDELTRKIEKIAVDSFKILNLSGDTRIDFLIDKGTQEVFLNETNTIPGSLAFYLWEEKGLDFKSLCDLLIKYAIKAKKERKQRITSFDTNVLFDFEGTKGSKKGK
jgi:D-alanine-D-alanine ligase